MNIDMSKALVPKEVIIEEVTKVFPAFAQYATSHTTYTTSKICHRQIQQVREHLIKRGFIAA